MSFVDLFAAMVLALVTLFASAFFLRVLVFGVLMRRRGCHGGHGHAHGGGRGSGRGAWRLFRELHLSRAQRTQIRGLFHEVRTAMRDLRGDLPGELAGLLGRDTFDRLAAERVAETRLARLEEGKGLVLDALARLHALLTPEQRAKVAAFATA